MDKIAILGSGMAGFGAAYRLHSEGKASIMYEKESFCGGHTASFKSGDFIFDDGPHISFTSDRRLQQLFAKGINQEYERFVAQANNYWKGYWIKHPAQCNLFGLPKELLVEIISEFYDLKKESSGEIANYKDWLVASYGKTFAKNFPMQYGFKFHTTSAENMSTDWIGPRLYQPDMKEVLYGALSPTTENVHYVNDFRYPSNGGFVSYLQQFTSMTDIRLGHEMILMDPENHTLSFANQQTDEYDQVITSIPLPELIPRIKDVPSEVKSAAEALACTSCIIVNIGIDRDKISDFHWTYFYDQDIIFTRLSFPHMFSPYNAPKGAGSIQAEIYYSQKYKPLQYSREECISRTLSDLEKCGLITREDNVLFVEAREIPYANIIFDLDRERCLSIVHNYLDKIDVYYCGRYGEWGYHWTDQSFISGENATSKIVNKAN